MITYRNNIRASDIVAIEAITRRTGFFREDEVAVAKELACEAVDSPNSLYRFVIAELNEETNGKVDTKIVGYTCYNKIECSLVSYDLDWIVVDKDMQGQHIGRALLLKTEEYILAEGGKFIYTETSSQPLYESTRQFYLKCGYKLSAEFEDFYDIGDNKLVFVKDCRTIVTVQDGGERSTGIPACVPNI